MKIIAFDKILEPDVILTIKHWLDQSGLLVYPTDTLYGIGGNYMDPAAHDAIDRIKGRGCMPYSMCVANFQMMASMASNLPEYVKNFYQKLLPGKFTFLLEASASIPKELLKGHSSVGLRVPASPPLLELIGNTGIPLITTSVNRSGCPPINNPLDIIREFGDSSLLLLDAGVLPPSKGSTILDLTSSPPRLVREGDDYERLNQLGITVIS